MAVLNFGVAGAGRMGSIHIENMMRTPGIKIIAVCTVVPREIEWVKSVFPDAIVTADFDEFLAVEQLDAVLLVTPTAFHKEQVIKSMHAGKHVICEKPIAATPQDAWEVYHESLKFPELKVACAFPRRYATVYMDAAERIRKGEIGEITTIRSQSADLYQCNEFFLNYIKVSGGIFIDCNIHDIDNCLFLIGRDVHATTAYAVGTTHVFPQFAEWGDVDDGMGIVTFEEQLVMNVYGSRNMRHAHHTMTEIIGTKGRILLNGQPRLNQIDISDETGTRMVGATSHMDVFAPAFQREIEGFRDWITIDKKPSFNLKDAAKAVSIAFALTESLREKALATVKEY
ncbi:uncharacterized protein V1516DRAFT_687311 [Lipomyces oligophaga]|uniref:uncharacterized protein n=1 Tax=Lipomyces oligophaga TaxID=45792 RepID=UPI0034CECA71